MTWDNERFQQLEQKIIASLEGKRQLDVPYYRYRYSPRDERKCIEEFESFSAILKNRGYSAECIYLPALLIKALQQLDFFDDEIIKKEIEIKEELESNLSYVLEDQIVYDLILYLEGKEISHCVVLLRFGCLFPFVHCSSLLSKIEGKIRCTIILPYPANQDGEMLGYHGESIRSYYRGDVI